jgi:hypothetical protein
VRQAEALTRVACEVNTEGATEGEGERLLDDEVSEPGSDERKAKSQVMSEVRRMLYIRMKSMLQYSSISYITPGNRQSSHGAGQVPHLNQKDHTPAFFAQSALS